MKKFNIKYILLLVGLFVTASVFNSCEDKDGDGSNTPITITRIFLQNAQSSVPDREVTFIRLGQVMRLEGSGFMGITNVLINGKSNYFNPVFVTDNSMLLQVSNDVPIMEALDDVRNTIQLFKNEKNTFTYSFEIRAAAPTITNISHTMPQAGDEITLSGAGLQEITEVTFPGGIQGTNISSDDEDGKWVKVTVPTGITKSGSLMVIGANGGAYSSPCFNYKEGLLHNFDNVDNYQWGSGIDNVALTTTIPNKRPQSQGGYQVFNASGSLAANADQRFWLNSSNLMPIMSVIPETTSANDCGIQMDIYVEGVWNSGIIRFAIADGWGSSRYCMVYQPVYVGGAYNPTAFENPGSWFTITLPFSLSADFEGKTFGDVIAQMSIADYKQSGPWFENTGITDVFDPVVATQKVYFDNIRIVPLAAPEYSDFPDEE